MGFSLGSLLDTIIVVECDDVVLHVRIQVAIHLGYRECSIVVALEGEGDVAQPDLRRLVVGDREAVGEKFGRAQPFGLHDDGERLDGVSAVVLDIGYIVLGDVLSGVAASVGGRKTHQRNIVLGLGVTRDDGTHAEVAVDTHGVVEPSAVVSIPVFLAHGVGALVEEQEVVGTLVALDVIADVEGHSLLDGHGLAEFHMVPAAMVLT